MADVDINKFRASVVREGSKPASPGFIVSEGQSPTDPAGSGQNHLPVTIATAATGLSITESQVLGGAGTVGQYIRGDGSLADFPESSGGGSSVSYYLNGSVAQGTIGGVAYKELNKVPILGAGTDFTINADGYIASFITDAGDPNLLEIPGGNWNFETYFSASSGGGSPTFYVELYKVNSGGTATLIASNSTFPELIAFGTNVISYFSTLAVPTTALALTDRLAIRYYVTHSGRTITLHTEDNHLCQIITTFTTGITALNGLTAQVQNFAVGTSGTDFAISSATATHTFNLPTASASNRGALSSADWTTFNNKTSNLGTVTSVGLSSATSGVTIGSTPVTTSGTITLAIATASGSQNGLLSSSDWTTFNSKQNALTNPVTGTGTSGQVAYFTGTTAISSESNLFWDATNDRLGIGINVPARKLDIRVTPVSTADDGIYINDGVGDFLLVRTGSAYTYRGVPASASMVYSNTTLAFLSDNPSGRISFHNNSGEYARFTSVGRFLLGDVSTDNGAKLQVSGTATALALDIISSSGVGSSSASGLARFITAGTSTGVSVGQSNSARKLDLGSQFIRVTGDDFFIVNASANATVFENNGAERMRITSSGNVLIGTTTDSGGKLRVDGDVFINNSSNAQIGLNTTGALNSVGAYLYFNRSGSNKWTAGMGPYTGGNNYEIATGSMVALSLTVTTGVATFGSLGTGTVSATSGTLSTTSDLNYKIEDGYIDSAIEKVLSLKPRYFYWNEKSGLPKDVRQLGFYAQEVNKALGEEAANTPKDSNTPWGISDRSIIAMLTKAIQEQQEIINDLKLKIQ
jgi:hypothetical protein